MILKYSGLLILGAICLTAGALRAQAAPRIDHLTIDNPTGRLTIFGNFGATPGSVTIDSLALAYKSWSNDSIVCIIPDTASESCGPVQINTLNGASNERLLSAWYLNEQCSYSGFGPQHFFSNIETHLLFRLDLASAIQSNNSLTFESSSSSTTDDYEGANPDPGYPDSLPSSDLFYRGSIQLTFNFETRYVTEPPIHSFEDEYGTGYIVFPVPHPLDDSFYPISQHTGNMQVGGGSLSIKVDLDKPAAFIPPDSVLRAARSLVALNAPGQQGMQAFSTNGGLIFSFPTLDHNESLQIYDICGRTLYSMAVEAGKSRCQVSTLSPNGCYFARLEGQMCKFVLGP